MLVSTVTDSSGVAALSWVAEGVSSLVGGSWDFSWSVGSSSAGVGSFCSGLELRSGGEDCLGFSGFFSKWILIVSAMQKV